MENSTVADRIRARIEALGKNPSAVALEAGLSRSTVLDILRGKAAFPRLDTLQKLTGPLECSLDYLTGSSTSVGRSDQAPARTRALLDVDIADEALELAVGIYREKGLLADRTIEPTAVYRDPNHPNLQVGLAVMADSSLADIGILEGDLLTYIRDSFGDYDIPLPDGAIVIARRDIAGEATEYSARQVERTSGSVRLVSRHTAAKIKPIVISSFEVEDDDPSTLRNYYLIEPDGFVVIEGIVIRVTRNLPHFD